MASQNLFRNIKSFYREALHKFSLRNRLLALFISILIISIVVVGISSYNKARDMTMESIENRLVREAELMGYIASNLKFVYVSDAAYFMQQLETSIQEQQKKLADDGISSDYFYITNQTATPFKVSESSVPPISESQINTIIKSKNGIIHETIEGKDYTITFQEMDEINGTYVLLVPTNSYMGEVEQMAYFTFFVILVSIFISTILIILFVRSMTMPLTVLRETMREVRDGNLHQSDSVKTTLPEITSLHKSYNSMIHHMTVMLNDLKGTIKKLEQTGAELAESSEDTLTSSHQLTGSIQVVKLGAEQTASSSENSADNFRNMKENIEEMLTNMNDIFKSSSQMDLSAKNGERKISELINTTRTYEKDFGNLTSTIKQVQEGSHSITSSVGFIQGIAEQTKLLSLNATIEAARAGESGKGFAVVADEVRKLAIQSSSVAKEITQSIANMEAATHSATSEFEQMWTKTKLNLNISNDTKVSIDEMMIEIVKVNNKLQGMQAELQALDDVLPELELTTEKLTSVSQETLASAEEMLQSGENQIEQMKNTHKIGMQLKDISSSLTTNTEQFHIGKE